MFAFVGSHMCECMDTGMAQRTLSKKKTACNMIIQQLYDYHVVLVIWVLISICYKFSSWKFKAMWYCMAQSCVVNMRVLDVTWLI